MRADYLTLTDGRKVRVEWNMNALSEFTRLTGKEMADLAEGKADVNTLRSIAWCAVKEGERMDGNVLELDELGLGALMNMANIVSFSEILTSQASGAAQKKSEPPNNFQKIFKRKG